MAADGEEQTLENQRGERVVWAKGENYRAGRNFNLSNKQWWSVSSAVKSGKYCSDYTVPGIMFDVRNVSTGSTCFKDAYRHDL